VTKANKITDRICAYARGILPHLGIVLSLMFFVFLVVDRYNRAMAFVNNDITKALLLIAAVITVAMHRLYAPTVAKLSRLSRAVVGDILMLGSMLSLSFVFIFFLDREIMVVNTDTVKFLVTLFATCLLLISIALAFLHRKQNT
jgi:hypothetical protein